jgi:hypothetical protein
MLAPSVGRRASARRYKRGTTLNRRETVRHKSSEAQRPGWALLVIDAVSLVPNQSPSFISYFMKPSWTLRFAFSKNSWRKNEPNVAKLQKR